MHTLDSRTARLLAAALLAIALVLASVATVGARLATTALDLTGAVVNAEPNPETEPAANRFHAW